MNFRELKEKVETLNKLNTLLKQKTKTLPVEAIVRFREEKAKLTKELDNYTSLFEVPMKEFCEAVKHHYEKFGKRVESTVETKPATGYHHPNHYITKDYVLSIYDNKYSTIKPEKRYVWYSRTVHKDDKSSFRYDLSFDLFGAEKTSLFVETPGLREVYWDLVRENCKEKYKQTPEHAAHKKFSKDTDLSFAQNKAGGAGTAAANIIK